MEDIDADEKLSDLLDAASKREMQETRHLVAQRRKLAAPKQVQKPDGSWPHPECVDCDEPLSRFRLEFGAICCVYCQEARDRLETMRGRR